MVNRIGAVLLAGLAVTLLSGCGKDAAPAVSVFTSSSKSQTVDTTGGTVVLADAQGNRYSLLIPAGALPGSTSIKITTLAPVAGQLFRIKLEPEGLLLKAGTTASLTITLPAGVVFPASGGFLYNGTTIPFVKNGDTTLTVTLSSFLGTASATASAKVRAYQMLAATGDFLLSPAQAATVAQCGTQPMPGSDAEGLSAELNTDLQNYIDCMQSAVHSMQINADFAGALRTSLAIAALSQGFGSDATAIAAINSASQSACSSYENALVHLTNTSVTNFGQVSDLVRSAMYWGSVVESLGADCHFDFDPQQIINSKVEEAANFYRTKKSGLESSTSSQDYAAAVAETGQLAAIEDEAAALHGTHFVANVRTVARAPLVDDLITAPWNDCHASGDYTALINLKSILNPGDTRAQQAAQYCATKLNATAKDGQGSTTATLSPVLGGISVSQNNTAGSVTVSKGGQLVLSGPIKALGCPSNSASSESLIVKFNGVQIDSFSVGDYLTNPLTYQINSLLASANLSAVPDGQLTRYPLTLTRTGNTCGGFWGANPQPLLTLTLNFATGCQPPSGASFCIVPILDSAGNPVSDRPRLINDKGTVVLGGDAQQLPSLWKAGVVTPLPLPSGFASGDGAIVTGINNSDGLSGYHSIDSANRTDHATRALRWSRDGVEVLAESAAAQPRGGFKVSEAYDINDSGVVVGEGLEPLTYSDGSPTTGRVAVAWQATGARVVLPVASENKYGGAAGINKDGIVVGSTFPGGGVTQCAKWQVSDSSGEAISAPSPATCDGLSAVDDSGFALTRSGSYFDDSNVRVALPTGLSSGVNLGPSGDTLVFMDSGSRALFNLHTQISVELNDTVVDPALGWQVTSFNLPGKPDRHGRLVGSGIRNGVRTPFILIPRGQPIPATAPAN